MAKVHFHDMFGGEAKVGELAEKVILLANPHSVRRLSSQLEKVVLVADHYEFYVVSGYHNGIWLSICSTGIGGGSATICVDSLATLGAKTFVFFGVGGSLEKEQDIMLNVALGAVRLDGASLDYARMEYPAVADPEVIMAISQAASDQQVEYQLALLLCNAGLLTPDQRQTYEDYNTRIVGKEYGAPIVPATPEIATILTLGSLYGIQTGAMFITVRDRQDVNAMESLLFTLALRSLCTLEGWRQEKSAKGWMMMTPEIE